MADPPPTAWFDELRSRGRLAPTPAPQPLPTGNQDRQPARMRRTWRVRLADGRDAKLTVGPVLGSLADRSAAFAAACPAIAAIPLFHERLAHGEILAETFFDGVTLDAAAETGVPPPDLVRRAFAQACAVLASTEQPSSESARAAEWHTWAGGIGALPIWTPGERELLIRTVLPALRASLLAGPPVTRWTNGDFLAANLLVASDGRVCLVDTEHSARTHFFPEDAVRFQILSESSRRQPDLFRGSLPDTGLPWHLFFWLRQVGLEVSQNTSDYLARVLPARRAVIRRLAENLFGLSLSDWSVAAAAVGHHFEEADWKPTPASALRLAGWCYVPGASAVRAIAVVAGGRHLAEMAPSARPDVQAHFNGDGRALHSGFTFRLPPVTEDAVLTAVAIADDGTWLPFATLRASDLPVRSPLILDYPGWAARHDPDSPAEGRPEIGEMSRVPGASSSAPQPAGTAEGMVKFSILLPVFNPPERLLRECIESVRHQGYPHWELAIVDDGSTSPVVRQLLETLAAQDSRIQLHFRAQNGGISRATNDALIRARNAFVVFLDHDDRLRPHALAELARSIAAEPEADVLYSDEEKISLNGERIWPAFKPDFSPEFLLGVMYPGHVLCVRTEVARATGGLDPAYDGVQDYEFFLRLAERTRRIVHVPRVLYQWRLAPTSSALAGNIKGDMDELQARAVRAHLARRQRPQVVVPLGAHRVRLLAAPSAAAPTISIIVAPDSDGPQGEELRPLLNAGDARIAEILADRRQDCPPVERLRQLAGRAGGDVLVMLGLLPPHFPVNWLAELAAQAALDDAGAVAPILLAADGAVFDAGWIVGQGALTPLMRGFDVNEDGYNGSLPCNRETSAVSGYCLAVRRDRYEKAGGIRPELDAALWAADLCLRLEAAGWRNRIAAAVRIPTRLTTDFREDFTPGWPAFAERWRDRLARPDPFYSWHFDAAAGNYRLARGTPGLPPSRGEPGVAR